MPSILQQPQHAMPESRHHGGDCLETVIKIWVFLWPLDDQLFPGMNDRRWVGGLASQKALAGAESETAWLGTHVR